MSLLMAYVHHLAAFTLVASLAVEWVLIRGPLSLINARQLVRVDRLYGFSAVVILVAGLLRLFHFEKGTTYYAGSGAFYAKMILFVLVGLLSIYPTRIFLSWRAVIRDGQVPELRPETQTRLVGVIQWELCGIVLILLCAVGMAKGILYWG